MARPATKTRTFKERLDELSGVVEKLEGGELSLEEAIERFEEGRRLHKELLDELAGYEKRLEKLAAETEPGSDRPEAAAPAPAPAPGLRGGDDRDADG